MTVEEKRKALDIFCEGNIRCENCPINSGLCVGECTLDDDEVEVAYKLTHGENTSIKDSGDRREFSTGAVRDMCEGKGRMDLLPWAAIMEVSKHCENGAKKYGEHNVDKGIPTHSLCDSAARHLAKYMDGWTDEPHLLAAAWNLLWAIQMEIKYPEMCDVPWRKDND